MQSHYADSCNTTNSPQGRLVAFSRQGSPAQRPVSVCQCQCASARPGMPSSLIGSPSVCGFVVYVYSTQLPAARRKARVCQLHDTTHGSSSSPRHQAGAVCRSYSAAHRAHPRHQSYCKVEVSTRAITRRPLRVDIVHRARRSANAMPAPQLYRCKLCHTCHTKRGLVVLLLEFNGVLIAFSELRSFFFLRRRNVQEITEGSF